MTESTCIFEYILCDDESDKIIMTLPILLGTRTTFEHFTGTYLVAEYKQSGDFTYVFCDKMTKRHTVISVLDENRIGKKNKQKNK